MPRLLTVSNLMSKKRTIIQLSEEFRAIIGNPEKSGCLMIYGDKGTGKTTFVLRLAKELSKHGRVWYNSLEEGDKATFTDSLVKNKMFEVKKNFHILSKEPMAEMFERMRKSRFKPDFVFIDSTQYTGLRFKQYVDLEAEFIDTLFIHVSQEEDGKPSGKLAKQLAFHADVVLRTDGFVCFSQKSRYGGEGKYIIWAKKAEEYHGFNLIKK